MQIRVFSHIAAQLSVRYNQQMTVNHVSQFLIHLAWTKLGGAEIKIKSTHLKHINIRLAINQKVAQVLDIIL